MKHKHQIDGDGHRIRFYSDGRVTIRLFGSHHSEVSDITGTDGHLDVKMGGIKPYNIDRLIACPSVEADCITYAKGMLSRIGGDA